MKENKLNVGAFFQKYTMILALVVVTAFFAIRTGGKTLFPANINNLIAQNAYVFVLAAGMLLWFAFLLQSAQLCFRQA